ncbi:MAG: hypothetical protein C4532_09395 [Candidatus Abyssobacteria bacterium SURF_17]|jgi:Fe-S-cluster containining protein|uniref:YkgJ family cysteine cluster protein n=1 Tax=Candidatus Abyssobacteria bacterium SURF_17 TaxID=2093361 RepID=A0A419EZ27_9BACT|nr:MAG: hypothetical protein C4532_09395 [Candidatus Abyssubacteria bacterium SURF_17]
MKSHSFEKKLRILCAIYRWSDDIALALQKWACRSECPTCCTASVAITTLEAAYLWEENSALLRERMKRWPQRHSLPPFAMTTNEHASLCIDRKECEEFAGPVTDAPCPLLEDKRCLCYEARPLMCRMLFSLYPCAETGQAEISSRLLSLNTVSIQMVEHLDQRGWSGYLVDLLPYFNKDAFLDEYYAGVCRMQDPRIRRNQPSPGLLVPPEHHEEIGQWLKELTSLLKTL